MKLIYYCLPLVVAFSCGTPKEQVETIVTAPAPIVEEVIAEAPEVVEEEPSIPINAVSAYFKGGKQPVAAYVQSVDELEGTTIIGFEDKNIPAIVLEDAYGANLIPLRFQEYERDLLLINSRLKDPQFNKYYLYKLQNGKWHLVVNGWAIHKSNKPDTLSPIQPSARYPAKMLRYYSVFDLDKESDTGYTWKLLTEEVAVDSTVDR